MQFYHSYKWLIPSLLFSIALIFIKVFATWNITGLFLCWNLFLGVLPLFFSYKAKHTSGKVSSFLWIGLWLLFFPNAIYIVTDIFHLDDYKHIPRWYSLILLTSAALNGLLYGLLSLQNIEHKLTSLCSRKHLRYIIFFLLLLCGYGIYLGRYLRWNSWDIICSPAALGSDISGHIIHPFRNARIWELSFVFAVWMYILYGFLTRIRRA